MSLVIDGTEYVLYSTATDRQVYHYVTLSGKPANCDAYWKSYCGVGRNAVGSWELTPPETLIPYQPCGACERSRVAGDRRVYTLASVDEIPDEEITHGVITSA